MCVNCFLQRIPRRQWIDEKLNEIWHETKPECVLFEWLSWFDQEYLVNVFDDNKLKQFDDTNNNNNNNNSKNHNSTNNNSDDFYDSNEKIVYYFDSIEKQRENLGQCPTVTTGNDIIIDRKSKFIAYMARVTSVKQVELFVQALNMNKKIARATHRILAYRIYARNGQPVKY